MKIASALLLRRLAAPSFVLAVTALAGCAATVVPPPDPPDPRPAFILDHGRHTTLVVVDSGGRAVRYAFGAFSTYADGDIGFFRGMGALLMPSAGTLGRRVLDGPPTPDNVLEEVGVGVEAMYCIAVSAERSNRLQRMLNLVFEESPAKAEYHAGWNLEFVESPEDYWFGSTANQAVEKWLVELGCEVDGVSTFANWKVEQLPGAAPAVCVDESAAPR